MPYTAMASDEKTNLQLMVGLNHPRFFEYLDRLVSPGLVQKDRADGDMEVHSLPPQGIDAYHRRVAWIRETMKG
jgi:predicted transcriptional regulator